MRHIVGTPAHAAPSTFLVAPNRRRIRRLHNVVRRTRTLEVPFRFLPAEISTPTASAVGTFFWAVFGRCPKKINVVCYQHSPRYNSWAIARAE